MVVWLRLEDGGTRRLVDRWGHSIFVAADKRADLIALEKGSDFVLSRFVRKVERATDREESEVLELLVGDPRKILALARRIEGSRPFGTYRLYNVDVPPEQMYLYENDLFPLALCEVSETREGLSWKLLDDNEACVYRLPEIRAASIEVRIRKAGRMPKTTDPIESIAVTGCGSSSVIDRGTEGEMILALVELVRKLDPDVILTQDGDSFTLPYVVSRAQANGVAGRLTLDREGTIMELPAKKGTSYFSYGKILFKPSAIKLRGRIHLDKASSFICAESGIDGFYEMSRVCRLPLHTASRASIGKALSSLQFYHAAKEGLLIPWKPALAEHFKSRVELLMGDRGGFIFEPEIGVHENIGELDFSSLFPSIMAKKNISAETVKCSCCPDSVNRVPELDWNVCERRPNGIVPKAVKVIVEKRLKYKALEKAARTEEDRARYASRKNALKWVGVASFGFLGFNNAKFGRIDAHMAVCAWDRKILMDAARVAERRGFRVMHGIVDSLWLRKKGAGENEYRRLAREIEEETGFDIVFEGIYKWIVFPPSKTSDTLPVLNRYFGAYRDGKLKVRGIEARRHDTPPLFSACQAEMLGVLAQADTAAEARGRVDECVRIFLRHATMLLAHEVPVGQLVYTRNLSRKPGEYVNRSLTASVADQLVSEGVELHAGESVEYVITDQRTGTAVPLDLVNARTSYDAWRYVELLAEACSTVLEPFRGDCSAEGLLNAVKREVQHAEVIM